jgi:predicted flap endonuclease-1-like 5' DNA nuclease
MAEFQRANLSGDLLEVPGIGPAAKKKLMEDGITNTYQLLGKVSKSSHVTWNSHFLKKKRHFIDLYLFFLDSFCC